MEHQVEGTSKQDDRKEASSINQVKTEQASTPQEKLEHYAKAVEVLAKSKSEFVFPNSSPDHAAIVISMMMKYSCDEVSIYDDCLNGDVTDKNPDLFFNSLAYFLSKGNKLNISVRDEHSIKRSHDLCVRLKEYAEQYPNKIEIRKANDKFKKSIITHFKKDINFAVGDKKSYRLEIASDGRKAECSFNRPDYAKKLYSIFKENFSTCEAITL